MSNTMHTEQWGIVAKFLYRYVIRKYLVKAAAATDNNLDDKGVALLDNLAGYTVK